MSKRKPHEEQELPFVALMDTMTNVVGVLIIVLVMVGLSVADAVKKVLSDLPPVTKEEFQQIQQDVQKLPEKIDPEKLEEDQKQAEAKLKKVVEELKTVDTADTQAKVKFMDLDAFQKQLDQRRKERTASKAETDKMMAEVERLKALLDKTPVYVPQPPKYVRLPNPRAYPEKPDETRILVARQGILSFHQGKFLQPILDGMEKVKSQLEYQKVEYAPFAKLLEGILGNAGAAQKAWPDIAPLVDHVQMEYLALAYKALAEGGVQPTKQLLGAIADLAVVTRKPMAAVADAIATATKGDVTKWVKMEPSADPAKPVIKASAANGKISFSWGALTQEVKATPKDVLKYFHDLAKVPSIENVSKARTIYDATRIMAMLKRAATSPLLSGSYAFEPKVLPTLPYVQLALTPKGGGGESVEAMKQPNSAYIRLLRDIKADPNGVAIFQVMKDAFDTYLEARKIADDVGVAATWDFLAKLDLTVNITGYEIQRTAPTPPPPAPNGTAPAVIIAPPKRSLD
ncbi:hypothetical protein [Prosthecobacter vanneervenii]|uniref:Uncharacterized protein n=1 Tax=Prosthecobacter vanneervenii TaxID=48466 RepID=A0A7W7Y8N9_9BACT|nr:hypothetical protein [Prosthecobacter vanneervenii]MBB5031584.1 hypothetical protein [Prosthecobacter vanneervenii]